MPCLPRFNVEKNQIENPHVVILGAGASIASCLGGDKNGLSLPSLQNIQEVTGINTFIDSIENIEGDLGNGFEAKYANLVQRGKYKDEVLEINKIIFDYFSSLELPDEVTIYDHLILGLREKDAIFTFNWDPFLLQAYKRCSGLASLPRVYFLHGCVGKAICYKCRVKSNVGFPCPRCGAEMEKSKLLFPVTEKNYEVDLVIKGEWDVFRDALSDAYFITIFGYSAPETDVSARNIIIESFRENESRELAEIEIIDIRDREEIKKSWKDFLYKHHFSIFKSFESSQIKKYYRRSCEAFAMATLQGDPVPENCPLGFKKISDLKGFAKTLVDEEESGCKFWSKA